MSRGALAIWGAPTGLAVASLVGLLAALLGDGPWDLVSWLGLGAPVLATGWALVWRRRAG